MNKVLVVPGAALLVLMGSFAKARAADAPDVPPSPVSLPAVEPGKTAIDVYTIGPAPYLWARWGHTVVCSTEGGGAEGLCYDFGIPEASGFVDMVWGTFRSKPRFIVERVSRSTLVDVITQADRQLEVQRLPLSDEQAKTMAASLERANTAHERYVYSPRNANCSSLVRDLIDESTGGMLRAMTAPVPTLTYREMTEEGLSGHAPELALIALTQGSETDAVPSPFDAQIVPYGLRDGITTQFGVKPVVVVERVVPGLETSPKAGRAVLLALGLGLAAIAIWVEKKKQRFSPLVRKVIGAVLGAIGLLLWAFVLCTKMPEFERTWIPLLLVPTDAAYGFISKKSRLRYTSVRVGLNLVLAALSLFGVLRQPLLVPALLAALPLAAGIIAERFGAKIRGPAPVPVKHVPTRQTSGVFR